MRPEIHLVVKNKSRVNRQGDKIYIDCGGATSEQRQQNLISKLTWPNYSGLRKDKLTI